MGASESKPVMRRSNSSASSFGRVSYASPSYRINSPNYKASFQSLKQRRLAGYDQGLSERNQLIRTNSLDLGGPPTVGEHAMLVPPAAGIDKSKYSTFKDLGADVGLSSPPIAQWLVPALCCAMAYALYNIFIKKGSASIHPILGGVILQFVAAIIGTVLCLSLAFGPTQEEMFYDSTGVMYALLAGASVGIAEIVSFIVSGMGVPAVQSIPIIIGGSVMFGTIIGRIFLAECLSPRGWFGVFMIATGISLVGMESEGMH